MYFKAENCIIPPHVRPGYEKVKDYPKNILIGHSVRWPKIISDLQSELHNLKVKKINWLNPHEDIEFEYNNVQFKYVFSPEGSLGVQTQIIKHAMHGAKNIINIGCVGAINPHLKKGSVVVCAEAIRDSGFGNNLASADEKAITSVDLNLKLLDAAKKNTGQGNYVKVWCVDTLYYTYERLSEILSQPSPPDVVEMEMEAGVITTNWLNANYFKRKPILYAHLGYISDILPLTQPYWMDPFNVEGGDRLIPWKKQAFEVAVKAVAGNEKREISLKKVGKHILHYSLHMH